MTKARPYIYRFLIILLVSSVLSLVISEWVYRLQGNPLDRGPEVIELVIPKGTAEDLENGNSSLSIPEEMTFVVGDEFVVKNQDDVAHELQPHLIPPGSSATMTMDEVSNLIVGCSFTSTKYLGISIKEATTWKTRLLAVSFAAPPTALVAFLYSLAIKPLEEQKSDDEKA